MLINDQEECSETERKAPRIMIFSLTEASRITIYCVTSLGSQEGVEKQNELGVMEYFIERLARPLVGGDLWHETLHIITYSNHQTSVHILIGVFCISEQRSRTDWRVQYS